MSVTREGIEGIEEQLLPLSTRRATIRLGQAIARALAPGDLVVLDGGLGAGKTFLVRAMLRALGVGDEVPVTSPTFALMNEYTRDLGARLSVVHADVYRLLGGDARDVEDGIAELGLRARRAEGWALIVEWGGDYVGALGGDALQVRIAMEPRVAHVTWVGERGEEMATDVVRAVRAPRIGVSL